MHLGFSSATHGSKSLEEVHGSVSVQHPGMLRRLFAFAGPAYMVSVGYMDPGNWATDLAGGASFGYALIWVLLMSNIMAVLLQTLSARLGLVTGRDLAQACRDSYNPGVRYVLFVLCEIAIAACDLAEVLGTAIGINLLTAQMGMFDGRGIPLIWAVLITALDVFVLLAIQRLGIRKMEAFIVTLVMTIGVCFIVEIFLSKPSVAGIASGFIPSSEIFTNQQMLYIAIGILGATVMPHNLYLHSALVQSRDVARTPEGLRQACRYNFWDSAIALNAAFFVNAAILVVAAATFWTRGIQVGEIDQAHGMLEGLLGSKLAPTVFAIALICAGQSSTLTGTLAGQITMEGFLRFRMRPWLRRMITRSIAIVPAVVVIWHMGEQGSYKLLIFSQVVLSLQLPFAVVPLVRFTGSRLKMGAFANSMAVRIFAWVVAALIIALNANLVYGQIGEWAAEAGAYRWLVLGIAIPLAGGLGGLLVWMTFHRERAAGPVAGPVSARMVLGKAERRPIQRVGVALEAAASDSAMLAEAVSLAKLHKAELVLMHVVEGVGGQFHGPSAGDAESRHDASYLMDLRDELAHDLQKAGASVRAVLGYGDVRGELVRLATAEQIDLLVVGGHGHGRLGDLFRGETITGVRHGLSIPVLAVREERRG